MLCSVPVISVCFLLSLRAAQQLSSSLAGRPDLLQFFCSLPRNYARFVVAYRHSHGVADEEDDVEVAASFWFLLFLYTHVHKMFYLDILIKMFSDPSIVHNMFLFVVSRSSLKGLLPQWRSRRHVPFRTSDSSFLNWVCKAGQTRFSCQLCQSSVLHGSCRLWRDSSPAPCPLSEVPPLALHCMGCLPRSGVCMPR
jgi:hypothetical protein